MAKRIRMEFVDHVRKLPQELLIHILSRLPAKSLMRCKCVCKSWSFLIRDPLFVKAHQTIYKSLNQHATNLLLATCDYNTRESGLFSIQVKHDGSGNITTTPPIHLRSPSFPFFEFSLVVSAGVVCYHNFTNDEIFNPTTREVLTIPLQRRPKNFALGFSSLTGEYKVLLALRNGGRSSAVFYDLKILTLGAGTSCTWRDLPEIDYEVLGLVPKFLDFSSFSLWIDGVIHWIQHTTNRPIILAFDVGRETFRVIQLPQDYNKRKDWKLRLIEVNGCVALFNQEVDGYGMFMDFWILKDYQNQVWFKDSIIFPQEWYELGNPQPVCSIHTGELLLYDRRRCGFVHLYDMKLKTYIKTDIVLPEGMVSAAAYDDENIFPLK